MPILLCLMLFSGNICKTFTRLLEIVAVKTVAVIGDCVNDDFIYIPSFSTLGSFLCPQSLHNFDIRYYLIHFATI